MDQAPRGRAHRAVTLLVGLAALAPTLSACAMSDEQAQAIIVASRDACDGFRDEIDAVNVVADGLDAEAWADALDDLAVSFEARAQRAPDPSRIREAFLVSAIALHDAAEDAHADGVIPESMVGLNNTADTLNVECSQFGA